MSQTRILQKAALGELFQKLVSGGQRVLAPIPRGAQTSGLRAAESGSKAELCPVEFAEVTTPQQLADGYVQTKTSAKTAVFPRHEVMLRYKPAGKDFQVEDQVAAKPTVLFGVHPCDAASFTTLKAVFTWDSSDVYFESKLAALTVIGMSCTKGDEFCFCTSVGLSPGSTKGCDILLTPLDATKYLAEVLTDKGEKIVALAPQLFTAANGLSEPEAQARAKNAVLAKIAPRFAADKLAANLPGLFPKEQIWKDQSLRCLGCGACAFVCPTCSCFDIQDEKTKEGGVRLRCWDSCGYSLFTLHASGHNPRHVQSERWRQRVMHKFSYQPERLGVLGCVGCGRCSRNCPVDMNLAEHVQTLAEVPA